MRLAGDINSAVSAAVATIQGEDSPKLEKK